MWLHKVTLSFSIFRRQTFRVEAAGATPVSEEETQQEFISSRRGKNAGSIKAVIHEAKGHKVAWSPAVSLLCTVKL